MLAESKDPLIIDQPEDALDIATIYKDLVTPVKERKIQRQFIFSSHNSALVVGGDSDKSFILDAKAKRGRLITSGEIEKQDVRVNLITSLEGGSSMYEMKSKR